VKLPANKFDTQKFDGASILTGGN